MYIFCVTSSFPNIVDKEDPFVYQHMYKSLLEARRLIHELSLESGGEILEFSRPVAKVIWNKLKEGDSISNFPLAKYVQKNIEGGLARLIGSTEKIYRITAFKL